MKKSVVLALSALLLGGCQESLEEQCAREAKEFTAKKCPAKIEAHTIIDSMAFERDTHTLHYYYRLTGSADQEGSITPDLALKVLKEDLKNSTSLKVYKDNGYRFAYTYRSEKDPKKVYIEVVLTEKDY